MRVPLRSRVRLHAVIRILFVALLASIAPVAVLATTFVVNSPSDVVDENPGDGICRTAPNNTVCTLRAAIMEANAHPGPDIINLQANTTYLLTRAGVDDTGENGDLDIFDSVTIVGAGPASTIIDGNGAATGDRVMQVFRCIGNAAPCDTALVVNISGVAFQHGQSLDASGGGIANDATLTLENCAFSDNMVGATYDGGGIYNGGTLTLINSTVMNNVADTAGIFAARPVTIVNSMISGNVSTGGFGGGGLALYGTTATITGSTISGNHTAATGGGIRAVASTLNLINTTISGNFSDGSGGGLDISEGTAGLYNVTIAVNQANADGAGTDTGGGVLSTAGATVTMANSVIADNEYIPDGGGPFHVLDDCSGTLTSTATDNKSNIVSVVVAAHCTIGGTGKYSAGSASIGPLQYNGGLTQTHALLLGSAAIDAGDAGGCRDNLGATIATDQRGVPRPPDASCDLGAFEYVDIIFQDGFDP